MTKLGRVLITTVGKIGGGYSLEITTSKEIVWMCNYNIAEYETGALYRAMRIPGLFEVTDDVLSNMVVKYPENIEQISAYPNPFNPKIRLDYRVNEPGFIKLEVLDIRGRIITKLINVLRNYIY